MNEIDLENVIRAFSNTSMNFSNFHFTRILEKKNKIFKFPIRRIGSYQNMNATPFYKNITRNIRLNPYIDGKK